MSPLIQASRNKKSIQQKLNSSNRKRKFLRDKNDKLQAQTKVILDVNRISKHDAWKDKKISNSLIQVACCEARTKKKASNSIVQAAQDEAIAEKRGSDSITQQVRNEAYAAHEQAVALI